jgi:hypothetical protein
MTTSTVETSPERVEAGKPETPTADGSRWSFGLTAVWVGVVGIIVALIVGVIAVYVAGDKAGDVATVASPAIAAISSITAAYFGIKLGQEGTKEATDTAKEANEAAADATKRAGEAAAKASASKGVALAHAKLLEGTPPGQSAPAGQRRGVAASTSASRQHLTAADIEDLIDRATT